MVDLILFNDLTHDLKQEKISKVIKKLLYKRIWTMEEAV